MTVSTSATFAGPFTPNGSTTVFPFTFVIMSADEIGVTINYVAADPDDYEVVLNGDGPSDGYVQFHAAPDGAGVYFEIRCFTNVRFRDRFINENAGRAVRVAR